MRSSTLSSVMLLALLVLASASVHAQARPPDISKAAAALTQQELIGLVEKARAGDAEAQLMVALAYQHGYGVQPMPMEAVTWARMSAEQGRAQAQHVLGLMYRDGVGVAPDAAEAVKWLRRSAEQGFPEAQGDLGLAYLDGLGVEQSNEEAFTWIKRAAEGGSLAGRTYLGVLYVNGLGTAANLEEGVRHLERAARDGSPMAQANLGALHANGMGVEQSSLEALTWYYVAEAGGFDGVQPLITELTAAMPADQVAIAREQAARRYQELTAAAPDTPSALDRVTALVELDEGAAAELREIGAWLSENLPTFGTFSVDIRRDIARARVQNENIITLRGRNTISDVVLDQCELRYTTVQSLDPSAEPLRWEFVIPVAGITLGRLRVQPYELPAGWRMVNTTAYQVELSARDYPANIFIAVTPERREEPTRDVNVPVGRRADADAVEQRLRRAAELCGAK